MSEVIIHCPVCGEEYSTDHYIFRSDYDELTRQNKILREVLTASKAALIRLGEGKTANVFMINEALKSCSGGDNE